MLKRAVVALFVFPFSLAAQVYLGPVTDPYAATRTVPGAFGSLPVLPTSVTGPMQVTVNHDLYAGFLAQYGAQLTNGFILWNENGSDSTCAVNTSKACKTWTAAVRTKTASFVYATCPASGTYTTNGAALEGLDYRFTDAGYGNGVKAVIFDRPCHLVFSGDNIATNTWAATGGHAGMYQTTIACVSATCGAVESVLRTDQNDGSGYVDEWGTPFPDRLFSASPNLWSSAYTYLVGQYAWNGALVLYQAINSNLNSSPPNANWTTLSTGAINWDTQSLANLDQLTEGFYFSPTTKLLYVKLNGLDLTNPANVANLTARYFPFGSYVHTGNAARLVTLGTTLFLQNAYLDAVEFQSIEYDNGGTWVPGQIWCQSCTIFNAYGYGEQSRGGAWDDCYACAYHANQADGNNADVPADGVTQTNMLHAFIRSTWAGDPHSYLSGVLPPPFPNANGESSHSGFHVDYGGYYSHNFGPEMGDGGNATVTTSQSWLVGTFAGEVAAFNQGAGANPGGTVQIGTSIADPTHSRKVWIENSLFRNEPLGSTPLAVIMESGAICELFNNTYDSPIFYTLNNPCTSYTPNAP
jgi:hypothetical protein